MFNMISAVTFPIFELLPRLLHTEFSSYQAERFWCITATNIALFVGLKLIIQLKRRCPLPGAASYATFILTLGAALVVEESLYSLYLNVGSLDVVPFFWGYIGLLAFTMMVIFLFRTVSNDSERESHYRAEIAMLSMTKQHQHELSQMYETLTARQHDYKHHLQTLEQLVSGGSPTAKELNFSLFIEIHHLFLSFVNFSQEKQPFHLPSNTPSIS